MAAVMLRRPRLLTPLPPPGWPGCCGRAARLASLDAGAGSAVDACAPLCCRVRSSRAAVPAEQCRADCIALVRRCSQADLGSSYPWQASPGRSEEAAWTGQGLFLCQGKIDPTCRPTAHLQTQLPLPAATLLASRPQRTRRQPLKFIAVAMPAVPAAVALAEDRQAKTDATKNQYIILAECALRLHLQHSALQACTACSGSRTGSAIGVDLALLCVLQMRLQTCAGERPRQTWPGKKQFSGSLLCSLSAGVSKRWSRWQRAPLLPAGRIDACRSQFAGDLTAEEGPARRRSCLQSLRRDGVGARAHSGASVRGWRWRRSASAPASC